MSNFDEKFFLQKKQESIPQLQSFSGNTNQILYQAKDGKNQMSYYIPAYIYFNFSSLSKIDYKALTACLLCNIVFHVNVTGLNDFLIQYLKRNIILFFNNNDALKLDTDQCDNDDDDDDDDEQRLNPEVELQQIQQKSGGVIVHHYLKFLIKGQFTASMLAHIDWTPFEDIDLILTIQPKAPKVFQLQKYIRNLQRQGKALSQSLKLEEQIASRRKNISNKTLKTIKFYFNLMDCSNKSNILSYETNSDFGNYRIATNRLRAQFTNNAAPDILLKSSDQINERKKQGYQVNLTKKSKVQAFQQAHYIITIYKIPNSAIITIFIPLFLLSIINLGIFNQTFRLAGRIGNLGSLVLAFVSLFPVIRQQIPPSPRLTKIQLFVYILTGTDLLCFVNSIIIRGPDQPVTNVTTDPFFIISLIITCLIFLVFVVLLLMHRCVWQKNYLKTQNNQNLSQNLQDKRFDHTKWKNQQCDLHFIKFFDNEQIKPIFRKKKSK